MGGRTRPSGSERHEDNLTPGTLHSILKPSDAGVAQLVEHLICNPTKPVINLFICNTFEFWVDGSVDGKRELEGMWSYRRDLNPRPAVYKTAALPTELR